VGSLFQQNCVCCRVGHSHTCYTTYNARTFPQTCAWITDRCLSYQQSLQRPVRRRPVSFFLLTMTGVFYWNNHPCGPNARDLCRHVSSAARCLCGSPPHDGAKSFADQYEEKDHYRPSTNQGPRDPNRRMPLQRDMISGKSLGSRQHRELHDHIQRERLNATPVCPQVIVSFSRRKRLCPLSAFVGNLHYGGI
jgi:hypothetical protein